MIVLYAAIIAVSACVIVWEIWTGESSADDLDVEEATDER